MRAPIARVLRRARPPSLLRDERGVTAVEFGLVGVPFILLIGAIIEASMLLLAQIAFDNAVDRAGRTVFTGVYLEGAGSVGAATRLVNEICKTALLFNCSTDKVKIEMTTAPTFTEQSASAPYDAKTGTISSSFGDQFKCPKGNEIVTIRAAAVLPRYFSIPSLTAAPLPNNEQLIMSTVIFRAEPFPPGTC